MRKILFSIKQILKMGLQNFILPMVYSLWRMVYLKKEKNLILFADAHHDSMPFSMQRMHDALEQKGYSLTDVIVDYGQMSYVQSVIHAIKFMKLYAQAGHVFICDNFLPVSSCRKSRETTVVQLLHSSGLCKKMGYDTTEDIPDGYKGKVYKNYDLVTVSAPCCVKPLRKAMHQPKGVVQALGTSRTDCYLDEAWLQECREAFYHAYPNAKDKKVILWAPTFRGNAAAPRQVGMEAIQELEKELGEAFFVIYKVHPHTDAKYHLSNCSIPTERLLPVTDLLISDYSSVINDFMFFDKPYMLFAPDFEEYAEKRGFYVPYDTLTPYVAKKKQKLKETVLLALAEEDKKWIRKNRRYHLQCCDGHATERIIKYLGL